MAWGKTPRRAGEHATRSHTSMRGAPHWHGLIPTCSPGPATVGRTSPVRPHKKTSESENTERVSLLLYDVSQTSTGPETSRAVRWANHVSWTCIRSTRQTGQASERGGGMDAVALASTVGLVAADAERAGPRSSRQRGSFTLRCPFAKNP